MNKSIYIILFLTVSSLGFGQNLDSLLQSAQQNNPRLVALQKWLEAEETKVRTGIYPDNPEVSYNYLFGNKDAIGNQQEFEITQPFKLPGYYTSKSAIQQLQFEQKQALAEKELRVMLHTLRSLYFNLVCLKKKEKLLNNRKEKSDKLVALMKEGFEGGEISKPAYDKVRIYAINIQNEWQKNLADIAIRTAQLRQLNGGVSLDNLVFEYPEDWMLPKMEVVLAQLSDQNPDLKMAHLGIAESEKQVKHEKMNSLPSFEAGYKSETILDLKLQGFHAGISIPLWQNANKVKHAIMQSEWSQANYQQKESELKIEVISLYNETQSLYYNYSQIKVILGEEQVSESSLELLTSGQISFNEYMVELDLVYDSWITLLSNQRDFYNGFSALKMFMD